MTIAMLRWLLLFLALCCLAYVIWQHRDTFKSSGYIGSEACAQCHPVHYYA